MPWIVGASAVALIAALAAALAVAVVVAAAVESTAAWAGASVGAWFAAQIVACGAGAAASDAASTGCSEPVAAVVVVVGSLGTQSSEIRGVRTCATCRRDDPLVLLRGQKCLCHCLHGRGRYHSRASFGPIGRPA